MFAQKGPFTSVFFLNLSRVLTFVLKYLVLKLSSTKMMLNLLKILVTFGLCNSVNKSIVFKGYSMIRYD
jgi:hypothetical protein